MEDPHFSWGNYIFKSSKGPFSIAMFLYRDVNNLPKPEARRCWRSSAWDLRHGHLGPRRRKVSSVGDFFFVGENDPRLPKTPLGLEVFGPQTHTIQTHPQEVLESNNVPCNFWRIPGVSTSSSNLQVDTLSSLTSIFLHSLKITQLVD